MRTATLRGVLGRLRERADTEGAGELSDADGVRGKSAPPTNCSGRGWRGAGSP